MKWLVGALALAAVISAGGVATAGWKSTPQQVYVESDSRIMGGAFADARSSADSVQFMTITTWAYGSTTNATATFRDKDGHMKSCTTTEPKMIAVLQSVKSDSQVMMTYGETGGCGQVVITTSSALMVKQP